MFISAREKLILQFLFENINVETTIKQLADIVNVSERTIHRDLKNIKDVLVAFHLKLQKKAGVGLKVIGTQSDIYQLRVTILKQDTRLRRLSLYPTELKALLPLKHVNNF